MAPHKLGAMKICKKQDCQKAAIARGLCPTHYCAGRRRGEFAPQKLTRVNGNTCRVEACSKIAISRGYCSAHYCKVLKYGDPLASAPKKTGGICGTKDCKGAVVAKGLCPKCYGLFRVRGKVVHSEWYRKKFTRLIDDNGYATVFAPNHGNARKNGRVAEHRYVMSKILGRPLLDGENVHHRNGVKSDNRPENLELWVTSQPSGQRPKDLVDWARQILERYSPEILAALDPIKRVAA